MIKKNSRSIFRNFRTGRVFLGKSERLSPAEVDALEELINQRPSTLHLPIEYPVAIKCLFYRGDHRAVDLDNLFAFPFDMLQQARIIENDVLVRSVDGSRKLYCHDEPRTEIFITRFEE